MVLKIPGAENFLEIKGIGIKTVSDFFAEIGDIRRFTHPKQIIKFAGLNVRKTAQESIKDKQRQAKGAGEGLEHFCSGLFCH